MPLTIRGPFHRWHYTVGFPNVRPVSEAARREPVCIGVATKPQGGKKARLIQLRLRASFGRIALKAQSPLSLFRDRPESIRRTDLLTSFVGVL